MYPSLKTICSGILVGFMVFCFTLTGSPPPQTVKGDAGTIPASPEGMTKQQQPAPQQTQQAQRPQQVMPADRPVQTQRSLQTGRPVQPRQPLQNQRTAQVQKTKQPKQAQTITPNVSGLTLDEQKMLGLVNAERVKNGLSPLSVNMKLTGIARLKARDMINNNYFSHTSPTYGSPFDMMRQSGISYRTAGENLAGASTVNIAHTNLMNSPGHRANILNGSFKWVGIGIVDGGRYGKMFVQMFTG